MKTNLLYWISTGMIALNWSFGGINSVLKTEASMAVFRHLGYPEYFGPMLGAAQLLGVIALLAPVPRVVREWAYAGLAFDAIAATVSLLAIGTPLLQLSFPLVALGLVFISYATWRRRSKVA